MSFEDRENAQKAIEKVNGMGYDNLILSVGWSREFLFLLSCLLWLLMGDFYAQSRGRRDLGVGVGQVVVRWCRVCRLSVPCFRGLARITESRICSFPLGEVGSQNHQIADLLLSFTEYLPCPQMSSDLSSHGSYPLALVSPNAMILL